VGVSGEVHVAGDLGGEPVQNGESIAVNGACLTVESLDSSGFRAHLSPETLRRTTLGGLRPGDQVNLERALRLGDRIGGHFVQGHVDATVPLVSVSRQDSSFTLRMSYPTSLGGELAQKGSVAVDGVSLTVSALAADWFEVVIVPATWNATILQLRRAGDLVNLETDVLAKYVRRSLGGARPGLASLLDMETHASD